MAFLIEIQNAAGLGLVVDPEEECPGGKGIGTLIFSKDSACLLSPLCFL